MQEIARAHRVVLEGDKISITGVVDVERFDEEAVVLETSRGQLVLRGTGFHVEELDLEAGALGLSGALSALQYEASPEGGLLARLFR